MIKITECYSIVTPESAQTGDEAESGIYGEHLMTFRALVDTLRGGEPSEWPCKKPSARTWVTVDQGETRAKIERGESEQRSFHFAGTPGQLKYWRWAFHAAGLIK